MRTQEFSIHLDDRIESLNRVSGDYVTGEFHITGQALDDEQIGTLQISYDGGINYQNLPGSPYTNPYGLDITIDTGPSGLDIPQRTDLRLKITDNANYQSITAMNLQQVPVPRTFPTGTGASTDINGNCRPGAGHRSGCRTVSGVEEIEVIVRGTLVYNPKTGATTAVGSYDFGAGSVDYPTGAWQRELQDHDQRLQQRRRIPATATASTISHPRRLHLQLVGGVQLERDPYETSSTLRGLRQRGQRHALRDAGGGLRQEPQAEHHERDRWKRRRPEPRGRAG